MAQESGIPKRESGRDEVSDNTGLWLYVSGPMSGVAEHNFPEFHAATTRLRKAGFQVVSPAELGDYDGWTWEQYLKRDLVELVKCEGVAVLRNWHTSRGAQLEVYVADALKLPVKTVDLWITGELASE